MAPTIMAAAIGTQRCTSERAIGAAERYQWLVPTAPAFPGCSLVVVAPNSDHLIA